MKIDIVYTWVDSSDPHWSSKRNEASKECGNLLPEANSDARFMDNDELKYSLRSIYKFAPWVNNIFIVTDNQIPHWLNTSHPKINIIDHKEIFKDLSCLPTFSSRAIETQIHNINNLSEHFISFNDDMFIGHECDKTHFFTKSGKVKVFVSEIIPIPKKKLFDIDLRDKNKRNSHQLAVITTRNVFLSKLKRKMYYSLRHGPKPILKSLYTDLEKIFGDEIEMTYRNKFRDDSGILILNLFCYYSLFKDKGITQYLRTVKSSEKFIDFFNNKKNGNTFGYINLHDPNLHKILNDIKTKAPFLFCLNQTPETSKENLTIVKKFLPEFYPNKSPFEK